MQAGLLGVLVAPLTPSFADTVTYSFTGTVDRVDVGLPDFALRNSMSASFTVDTTPFIGSNSSYAAYPAIAFQLTVGPYTVSNGAGGYGNLQLSIGDPSIPIATSFFEDNSADATALWWSLYQQRRFYRAV